MKKTEAKDVDTGARDDLRTLFAEAFDAGWDRSDECDNAYNNGTSEQLSVPPQAQEPRVFQEWRAEYFSDRDEVVTNLLARAARASTNRLTDEQILAIAWKYHYDEPDASGYDFGTRSLLEFARALLAASDKEAA